MNQPIKITQIENGLTIATDRMNHVDTICLGIWVNVGTRHEEARHNGIAHLLEHMNFKGTGRRNALDIAIEIENVGGYMNAHTGREQTAFYVRLMAEDWRLGLDMIADIVQHSTFDPNELDRERQVVLQEIAQAEDNPDDVIFDWFQEIAFPGQAMGRPILGSAEIVSTLQREDLIEYREKHYRGHGIVLAASGNIAHELLVEAAARLFSPLPKGEDFPLAKPAYQGGEKCVARDLEQVHIALGFEGVPYGADDYFALSVLAQMLGGGMSSRLFQEVREKRGLAYSIGSFSTSFMDTGLFGIYAGTSPSQTLQLLPVIKEELYKIQEDATESELARAARQLKSSILMAREKCSARCEQLASQILIYGRPVSATEIGEKIDRVTVGDITRISKRIFAAAPSLSMLGPAEGLSSMSTLAR